MASAHDPEGGKAETPARGSDEKAPLAIASSKCLIMDDNNTLQQDTADALKAAGFETVETAFTVEDALTKLAHFEPGLAILDMNFSNGQPSEPVAKALRERGIPFIFVTAHGDRAKPRDFATIPILQKPLQPEDLRSLLWQLGA
jgi:DNA-binding response OmpR family regulator